MEQAFRSIPFRRIVGTAQIRTGGVRKCRSLHIVPHRLVTHRERSGSRTPVVQGPTDLPVWYRLCTHRLSALFRSDLGEPYKSVQEVYQNGVQCRLFSTAWCTSVSGHGVVHLFYKVLRDLPL